MDFIFRQVEETTSTNEDLKEAAKTGTTETIALLAKRQTAGRGRQGRTWLSPEGNVYLSVLVHPACAPAQVGHYAFITALAVSDVVLSFLPSVRVEIKWPNDVLVDGAKISGILLESGAEEKGLVPWLVIGSGINVAVAPEGGAYAITSLAKHGATVTAAEVAQRYLERLGFWIETYNQKGFLPIREAWLARAKRGPLCARLPQEEVFGTFSDLDGDGCLILLLADGVRRRIASGDVFVRSSIVP